MNLLDDERVIVELLQGTRRREICYVMGPSLRARIAFEHIYDHRLWKKWVNSSGKADLPPDFFNDKFGYMMEVMRVDDHAHVNEHGVLVNPTNKRESEIQKEIRRKIRKANPNYDFSQLRIFVNPDPKLPSLEDHNYIFYLHNFRRVLKKHVANIPLYRKNHPGKKLIFLICDESTAYLEIDDKELVKNGPIAGRGVHGVPVRHYCDEKFIEAFLDEDIDYIVWFVPYKMIHGSWYQLPKICVIDVKRFRRQQMVRYDPELIISAEA